jgi:hypothetical protein
MPKQETHEGAHTPSGMSRHHLAEGPGVEKAAPIIDYHSHKRPDDPDYLPEATQMPGVDVPDPCHGGEAKLRPQTQTTGGMESECLLKGEGQEGMGESMGGSKGGEQKNM